MVIKKGPLPRARLTEGDRRTPRVQYIRYNTVVATNCRFRVLHSDGTQEIINGDERTDESLGFAPPLPNTTRVVHAVEETGTTDDCIPPLEAAPEANFRPRTPPGRPRYPEFRPRTPPRTEPLGPIPPIPCLPPPYPQCLPPRLPRFTLIRRKQ